MLNTKTIELENVIVEATKRLEIEMFKEFSVHVEGFKNNRKQYFINDLETAFKKFRESGDTLLKPEFGNCGTCNKGCLGYLFVGNRSRNYISLIFQIDGSKIIDMAECCNFKPALNVQNLNQRIYIHSFNDKNSEEYVPF